MKVKRERRRKEEGEGGEKEEKRRRGGRRPRLDDFGDILQTKPPLSPSAFPSPSFQNPSTPIEKVISVKLVGNDEKEKKRGGEGEGGGGRWKWRGVHPSFHPYSPLLPPSPMIHVYSKYDI